MNKRALHHYWRFVRGVKPWQLAVLLILLLGASVWAYRQNSKNVIPLVQTLIAADESGQGVDKALRNLGNYMTNHMNSQIGSPIRLENTFYRAYDKAIKDSQPSANGGIYKQAQAKCEDPNKLLSERALCVQEFVLKNAPPGQDAEVPNLPVPQDYEYTFVTPLWSPDLAGWLIAASALAGIILLARITAGWLVIRTLKKHA